MAPWFQPATVPYTASPFLSPLLVDSCRKCFHRSAPFSWRLNQPLSPKVAQTLQAIYCFVSRPPYPVVVMQGKSIIPHPQPLQMLHGINIHRARKVASASASASTPSGGPHLASSCRRCQNNNSSAICAGSIESLRFPASAGVDVRYLTIQSIGSEPAGDSLNMIILNTAKGGGTVIITGRPTSQNALLTGAWFSSIGYGALTLSRNLPKCPPL